MLRPDRRDELARLGSSPPVRQCVESVIGPSTASSGAAEAAEPHGSPAGNARAGSALVVTVYEAW